MAPHWGAHGGKSQAVKVAYNKMLSHLDFHRVICLHQHNHEARTRPCPTFDTSVYYHSTDNSGNHTPVVITDGNSPTGPSLRPE